jgi:hypothetical protein
VNTSFSSGGSHLGDRHQQQRVVGQPGDELRPHQQVKTAAFHAGTRSLDQSIGRVSGRGVTTV